ncbi:hypothetical protein CG723_08185 [Streptomyces sp. CB01635]|nr:hypothetical protein CG723_08185 [Streptomyces sp. CB01635]
MPGRAMQGSQLARHMTALGIPVKAARNTAVMALAAELPAVAFRRLLGMHIDGAIQWSRMAGAHQNAYAAELSRRWPECGRAERRIALGSVLGEGPP